MEYLILVFSLPFLGFGLYNLYIGSLSRKKGNLASTLGRLICAEGRKNVYSRRAGKSGKFKNYTHFTYEYTVGEKRYEIHDGIDWPPGKLPKMPRVIYLKQKPNHSYVEGVTQFHELVLGGFLLFGGCVFVLIFLLAC